ncbi:unnamed protein product [Caenorhabditis bovis]|uniref:SEC7 domain-containing protein n=1 Tax=Caenorhabditis bovis TaxID=2654633 RepID=A0A8S1F7C5_9PELO|nr:unnamed protein product [Caenorhabditis bovis]
MEASLNGLWSTVKHNATKEAIAQAKEVHKRFKEKNDVPLVHLREKCLAAFELAFDNGSEKHYHYAIDGVQVLLRDQTYHDQNIEDPKNNLPVQVLHAMTGIDEWKGQLQCKCVTLLVEMICSNELKIALSDVEECVQIYKRLYGKSEEERVRVACRAATTQSLTAYFSNRYSLCEGNQDSIAVYLDVCKLLEELCAEVEQMSSSHEQCLIALDCICALLTTSNLKILSHQPFVNLLWEKICPLIILLLGIPEKGGPGVAAKVESTEEPVGEGQIDFALAPAILTNPHTWRALYQIVDQLIRLMINEPSLNSSLEALFHKAFLFPRLDQRSEALKLIKKIVGDGSKLSKIARSCIANKSLSLWRMLITCIAECANPQLELSIDSIRTVVSMLDGMKQLCSHKFFTKEERELINEVLPTVESTIVNSFTINQGKTERNSESVDTTEDVFEENDEISEKLRRLEQKFGSASVGSASNRRSSEYDESSEKSTAKRFVQSFAENIENISNLKSTLAIDEAILQFSSDFYTKFCSVHADAYKSRSKIQQEFLNTDAIYLTTYATLCFSAHRDTFTLNEMKRIVLTANCVIHVSHGWLEKVFESLQTTDFKQYLTPVVRDVINDFDGFEKRLLSDVEKLKRIQNRSQDIFEVIEEKNVARWMTSSAWQLIIDVLSTFLPCKGKGKVREKIREAISLTICGMRNLASVAQLLGLEERCGWIFEQLVETSCCLEDLRNDATAPDNEQKSTCTSSEHLLAMQLVLDEARMAIHSPACWKHVIRCTEYVWELEKYVYGALCYEKPSRLKFLRRKTEEKEDEKDHEKTNAADSSIENALGDEPTLSIHSLNRAICVLIAKVDRFYSHVCRELCLPALFDLCVAIISSSENRIFYSSQKSTQLTAPVLLLTRISDIISTLSHRPLIHQMFIWPLVSSHFVKVCQCEQESRIAASALSEVAVRLLVNESAGLCFNQTLIVPFQTASCSDACSDETKEQLLCALSSLVLSQADKIGSGWKPLFGSLKAVSACNVEKVHWCAIDVISSYLRIDTPTVLSSSILECVPCVVNLLQYSGDEVSSASIRLLPSIYSLILYLYKTPHSPSYHILHRSDLRSKCLDCVELDEKVPATVSISHGPLPWINKQTHEIASVELFLSFMEQICGSLLTSNSITQKNLLDMIGRLLIDISNTCLGPESGGACMSIVILPYVHKWIRRIDVQETKILKQVIGACTQTVIDMINLEQMESWRDRLLRDICALIVECILFDKTCAVAPAYFSLIASNSHNLTNQQWSIFVSFLSAASELSLRHVKLINSFYVRGSTDENGDIGSVTAYHPTKLQFQQFVAAVQVFSSKRGRAVEESEYDSGTALLMLSHGQETHRIEMPSVIGCLLTHCFLLQLIASLLISDDEMISPKLRSSLIGSSTSISASFDDSIYSALYSILENSSETAIDFDLRPAAGSLLSKMVGIDNANLLKIIVSSNLIKSQSLLRRYRENRKSEFLDEMIKDIQKNSTFLKDIEFEVCTRRAALPYREHAISSFHLIPVEDEENAYKLVSQEYVDQTMSEYEKHRERLKPVDRRNPFQHNFEDIDSKNGIQCDKEEDFDEIRLAAYRDICTIPLRSVCDQFDKSIAQHVIPAVSSVIVASPDLSVRNLAVDYLAKLNS